MSELNIKKKILIIFFLSLIMQLVFISLVDIQVRQDALTYYELSKNIAKGDGFVLDGKPCPNFSIKPLYCIFLAGIIRVFGENIFIIKIIQAIIIALSCLFVFKSARIIFGEKVGFWSAFIMAIYPPFVSISSHLISESLFIFLLTLSIYFWIKGEKEDKTILFVLSALFMGLSTQVRATSTFLPLFIFFFGLWRNKSKLKYTKRFILFLAIVIACIVPWTVRNYLIFKVFSPVSSIEVLWQGTYVDGGANSDNSLLKIKQQEMINSVKEDYTKYNEIALTAARENLRKHFLGYLALFPVKFIRLWIGSYSNLFDISVFYSDLLKSMSLLRQNLGLFLFKTFNLCLSASLLLLGLLGMGFVYKRKEWRETYILFSIFVYFSLLHMFLIAEPRYGLPALPYLIIFAIFALANLRKRGRDVIEK